MLTRRDFFKLATGVLAGLGLGVKANHVATPGYLHVHSDDNDIGLPGITTTDVLDDTSWLVIRTEDGSFMYSDDNSETWQELPDGWCWNNLSWYEKIKDDIVCQHLKTWNIS